MQSPTQVSTHNKLMRNILAIVLTLALGSRVTQGMGWSLSPGSRTSDIVLRLVQPQHGFPLNKAVAVRVEISNEGDRPLLVSRDLDLASHFYSWDFETFDSGGNSIHTGKIAGDSVVGPPPPFSEALIAHWIVLGPHYTYGKTIDLGLALGLNPRPDRYRVRAILSSDGPNSPSVYNDLLHYPEELAKLPFAGWKGTTRSNAVSIEIIPHT
jgi:hypothetical protein